MDVPRLCPVCTARFERRKPWLFACSDCGFFAADLPAGAGTALDGIDALREDNFRRLLDRLEALTDLHGKRLLEAGPARGLFLKAADARGMIAAGLEPDDGLAAACRNNGLDVRAGAFPDDVAKDARYDVIVFNDVFEHLPDIAAARAACVRHLSAGGYLVINIPASDGVFYRLAAALDRVGLATFFDRLWQRGLPSPHLSYFNRRNLQRFIEADRTMSLVDAGTLPSFAVGGLWPRLRFTYSAPVAALLFCALVPAAPLLGALPADIMVLIFRKSADRQSP
jgi:SAM-dependent methyltransferase